mgnify:FL=1
MNYNNRKGETSSPDNFESELILIDEPENHFSVEELKQILETTTPKATVIFVTHHLDFVENVSDKVLVLHYGAFKGVYNTQDFFTSKDPYISYIATMGC